MSAIDSPVKRLPAFPAAEGVPIKATLPSPSIFDILPALYDLLSRLVPSPTSHDLVLEPHQLAVEASSLKIKLQKARAAISVLPGVDRTIAEQEEEIRELEDLISQQRNMLHLLAEKARDAGQSSNGDHTMEDGA